MREAQQLSQSQTDDMWIIKAIRYVTTTDNRLDFSMLTVASVAGLLRSTDLEYTNSKKTEAVHLLLSFHFLLCGIKLQGLLSMWKSIGVLKIITVRASTCSRLR